MLREIIVNGPPWYFESMGIRYEHAMMMLDFHITDILYRGGKTIGFSGHWAAMPFLQVNLDIFFDDFRIRWPFDHQSIMEQLHIRGINVTRHMCKMLLTIKIAAMLSHYATEQCKFGINYRMQMMMEEHPWIYIGWGEEQVEPYRVSDTKGFQCPCDAEFNYHVRHKWEWSRAWVAS